MFVKWMTVYFLFSCKGKSLINLFFLLAWWLPVARTFPSMMYGVPENSTELDILDSHSYTFVKKLLFFILQMKNLRCQEINMSITM